MKYFLISLVFAQASFAQHSLFFADQKRIQDSKSWEPYNYDPCVRAQINSKGLRKCDDLSISFVQPDSVGIGGWEGKCGQTAASNSHYHLCQVALDPDKEVDPFMKDVTPGVLPRTLARGLNKILKNHKDLCPKGSWKTTSARNNKDYIAQVEESLKPKVQISTINVLNRDGKAITTTPVMALIVNPGSNKYLHWVTIIDIERKNDKCDFYINHWSNQYKVPCDTFAGWASKVGRAYPLVLKSYTTVIFE